MNKLRVYIDTSVIGGYFDKEFEEDTKLFFERFDMGKIMFVISDLFELELLNAPINVRELFKKYPYDSFERVKVTEEAIQLAELYLTEGIEDNYKKVFENILTKAIMIFNILDKLIIKENSTQKA